MYCCENGLMLKITFKSACLMIYRCINVGSCTTSTLVLFIISLLGFAFLFDYPAYAREDNWALVSAPCDISYDLISQDESGEKILLFEWNGDKFSEARSIRRGGGYVTNSTGALLNCNVAVELNPWDEKALVLNDGWNLVGNPYPYSISIKTILPAYNPNALGPFFILAGNGQYVSANTDTQVGEHEAFWVQFASSMNVPPSDQPEQPPWLDPCGGDTQFIVHEDTGMVKSTKSLHGTIFTYVYNSSLEIYMDIVIGKTYPYRPVDSYYDNLYFKTPDELLALLGLTDKDFADMTIIGFTDWETATCYKFSWINEISYYKDRVEVEIIRYIYSLHERCWALEEPGQYVAVPRIDVPVEFNIKEVSTRQEYINGNKVVDGKPACNFY